MRLLFLIRSLGSGGAERQLILLANGLAERGHEIHLATFYRVPGLEGELTKQVHLHDLAKSGRWDILGFFRRYIYLCRAVEPMIVHSYMPTSNIVAALGRFFSSSKVVWGIRTSQMPLNLYSYSRLSQLIEGASKVLACKADLIICNSEAGRRYQQSQGYPIAKIAVIPNGIDTVRFAPEPDSAKRALIRKGFGVSLSARILGFIGRLDPVKNIELLIDGFAASKMGARDCVLLIVGDGDADYHSTLERRVLKLGIENCVKFLPGPQIADALKILDIGLSTSLSEGFSNTIAEMMANGVPCIVTDVGDSQLIVGSTGEIIPSNSVASLADRIRKLLELSPGDLAELGSAARHRIEREFSVATLVNRTEAALTSLT